MNKKITIAFILIIIVILGLLTFYGNSKPPTSLPNMVKNIKVGVIAPLTGDYAVLGEELKKGIDLAVGELQSKGLNISIVYGDDKFDPKETVSAANKLLTIDKVDFAMIIMIEEARPVTSIFNKSKTPLIVTWDSNAFLKNAGQYIYSNGFSTEKAGEIMADYAFNKLNLKNIAVLSHVDAWSDIISKSFEDQFKKKGGKVVYSDAVQVGTNDFRLQILKIKSKNPDGVYFPLIPFDSVSFIKQAKENKLNVPMMSGDGLIQDVVDAVGIAANDIFYTNGYTENTQLPSIYKNKYGKNPYSLVYAASGYDALIKIGESLNGTVDIKTALDNAFGSTRSSDRIEKIYQIKDGISKEVN